MILLAHCVIALDPALPEQSAFQPALDAMAPVFDCVPLLDGARNHPLLTITQDGGARTSVSFWAAGLRAGLGLANPGDFPWCLANASCAALARRYAVTGPNYTWMATDLARPAAYAGAAEVLADPATQAQQAWVMASVWGGTQPRLALWSWGQGGDAGADLPARMAADWAAAYGHTA